MKICVLQPDYGQSSIDYRNYDPPRDLSHLVPEVQVDHAFINKISTYRQLKELKRRGYDLYVNLCEAYLDWDIPSVDVVQALEALNLPYTGPSARLYDPPKSLMKYVAFTAGVRTPNYATVKTTTEIEAACAHLSFPLFVKPGQAGDSLGINARSLVATPAGLAQKVAEVIGEFEEALVEEYIAGREFTVLVAGDPDPRRPPVVYRPLEFVFPPGESFKTYDLKVRQHHPECNVPCREEGLDHSLRDAARRIFQAFGGESYARLDFRVSDRGDLFFLEINFTCSIFYPEGYEGSADYILKFDGAGQTGFLRQIMAEGIARHRRRQKVFDVRGNAIDGYGIYAAARIAAGAVVFAGEGRAQRLITLGYLERHWSAEEVAVFRRYAYPLSEEVFLLWDEDPREWAPQNHSCQPNTAFRGLNVYALRSIEAGEELTLDYADFLDEHMAPFPCRCGAPNCRGMVYGIPGNSVSRRMKARGDG